MHGLVRRILDLLLAVSSLVLLLPVFLLAAVLVKASSRGPIFYKQARVGQFGKLFYTYKFRSMFVGADKVGTSVTRDKDPRITAFGSFLRWSKIDELPQLWNVIKGDLSLVGPRPEVPEIVETYSPEMRGVLAVKPGITNLASLLMRRESELLAMAAEPDKAYVNILVPAKIELALKQVERRSLSYDLWILVRTVFAVFNCGWMSRDERVYLGRIKQRIRADSMRYV